ncbi:MAG: hypothetical protein LUE24_05085, partial [Lachnospiraceae bacterium]|nr:hypothetical protein [Lachnospiraceae bacterium]
LLKLFADVFNLHLQFSGIVLSKKISDPAQQKTVIVIFVILALVVFFVGGSIKREANSNNSSDASVETITEYCV